MPSVVTGPLAAAHVAAVRALVADATRADGVAPLNERATLRLGREPGHVLVTLDGEVVGYAQVDPDDATAQLVVAPAHRRRGIGRSLCDAVEADQAGVRLWAFGDLPAARALAAATGRTVVRELLVMGRSLTDLPEPAPTDRTVRAYTSADADGLLAANAAAFAHHREQGAMTRAELAERMTDPADLLLAVAADGRVDGFHWTKRHGGGLGEVYVIGVHPRAEGAGLGRTLLWRGLHHLAARGCDRVILYVEGDNPRAVGLYERSGFTVEHRDVQYQRPGGGAS